MAEVSELSVAIDVDGGWRYSVSLDARMEVDPTPEVCDSPMVDLAR